MSRSNRSKTILVVDDEPNVRLVFRTALESPANTVAAAQDGETALAWLDHSPADLVLLDLQMPGMDGMEVLRLLRERGKNVPVVIVTAHGSVPNAVTAMKLGAIDFVSKPLTPESLRRIAAEVLERNQAPASKGGAQSLPPSREPVTIAAQFLSNLSRAKRALNLRDLNDAEIFLKQAIALDPSSAEAHNLKGVLHECRNDHDAAFSEYRAALKADRNYEPAKHNMTRYYERFTFGRSDVPIDTGA
jgi:DNA-binding response OmpR family regulator